MRVKVQIIGKVQGVFFRHSAKQRAQALKLSGWIKNLPDGSVAGEAAGSQDSLQAFIEWCKEGPANAQVKNVTVEWLDGENKEFLPQVDFNIID